MHSMNKPQSLIISTLLALTMVAASLVLAPAGAEARGIGRADGNPADTIHPNILDNVGKGNNANPNGVSPTGGGNLHGIGNVPGKNERVTPGVANLEHVHGGIGAVNKNVISSAGGGH